jgi:hypothetical protein
VTRLFGPSQANRVAVLGELMLKPYDVLHYAGHCFYNADDPPASGWLFGRDQVLSAHELRRIDRIPKFVLSNACESGITPDRPEVRDPGLAPSFAESFFERGVANFVCTAWPVDDAAARLFALYLYASLLGLDFEDPDANTPGGGWAGASLQIRGTRDPVPMYKAMHRARCRVAALAGGARTWGAYQHYGNPYFRFFDPHYLEPRRTPVRPKERTAAGKTIPPPTLAGNLSARFAAIKRAIDADGDRLRRVPGVIAVRPGFRYQDGWTTGEPAVVVTVAEKKPAQDIPTNELLPREFDGFPVDVTPATPLEQLRELSQRGAALSAGTVAAAEDELLLPGVDPASVPAPEEERGLLPYKAPPGVPLDEINDVMTVTCHVSPDDGWPVLKEFLGGTKKQLTVGMYDFTAPHVLETVKQSLQPARRTLNLILDPALALTNGEDADTNPKADDVTEDEVRDELTKAMKSRFHFAWAAVKFKDKVTQGIFPRAYHIKVAVRDGQAFWLSSGNWQSSNQPPDSATLEPGVATAVDMAHLFSLFNREWHVVVEHEQLAGVFEKYLLSDLEQAEPLQAEAEERGPAARLPDLLIPVEALERGPAAALRLFPHKDLPSRGNRRVRVQPLLTPDNYAAHVADLIRSAKQKLYFQNQYINIAAHPEDGFRELVDALKEKVNDASLDTRVILRNIGNTRKMLEALEAAGFNMKRVRLQTSCHNKGIIVDGQTVLVGSHNWSSLGTTRNRDASLIFFDPEIAAYYEQVFLNDWDGLASQKVLAEHAMPRVSTGQRDRGAPPGTMRIAWDAYFED